MALGFTVETLLPYGRSGSRLTMGLSRLDEADWLWPDFDRLARQTVFDRHPEAIRILPEAEAAGCELAAMLGLSGGLGEAARTVWEDLCILQSAGPGEPYRLTGAAVGFPTDWRLEDKIGLPLAAIHAPIHGYAEQLTSGVDRFMEGLAPGPIFGRANWFVVANDSWRYLPESNPQKLFSHVSAESAGNSLFVRCERQTLRRLPQSGAIVFTIGIAVAPLASLPRAQVERLVAALSAQPEDEQGRRSAPAYLDALAGYCLS
ncbi:MAG: DUF3445 domain-containing protein [Sphingobium sp.]|nr:DUF3445 domain-containing protein [Sphingobium sp.]